MKRERCGKTCLAPVLAKFRILIGALHERSHMLLGKQGIRLAFYGQSGFVIGCALKAHHRGSSRTGTLLEKLTVDRLLEQVGEEKGLLKILAAGTSVTMATGPSPLLISTGCYLSSDTTGSGWVTVGVSCGIMGTSPIVYFSSKLTGTKLSWLSEKASTIGG